MHHAIGYMMRHGRMFSFQRIRVLVIATAQEGKHGLLEAFNREPCTRSIVPRVLPIA